MSELKEFKDMNDTELLQSLKDDVVSWFNYWQDNIAIFHKATNFIFHSNLTQQEKNSLNNLQRPPLEFNILEAYISRLTGEFSKQEPSFIVHESPDTQMGDPRLPELIEGHLASVTEESKKDGTETEIYKDMIACGYSVAEVFYEYASPTSFNQNIKFRKLADPTMCGFDPLAQDKHKGDGRYYFRVFPMTEREFIKQYPDADISTINFNTHNVSKFSFSYKSKNEKVIAVCVYYGKVKTRKKIVYLSNDATMSQSMYNKMVKIWTEQGYIEQIPKIIKTRMAEFIEIVRYDFIENQILEKSPTLYTQLPGIFFDGNSVRIRYNDGQDDLKQTIRPYWKNAEGAQRLKNLAGQTLANEIENIVNHKFKVPKEGIPVGYEQYYINNQKAAVLVYNGFMPDGLTPIPPPQEVMRQPVPQEVSMSFVGADQAVQNILGSYDASLGINDNQLSGVAIVEAATQSNAAAMPYVVNFMTSFSQVAKIIIGLMPKVFKNPRKINVLNKKRQKEYVDINNSNIPDSVHMTYDPMSMNVVVQAGTNFEVQKNKSMQMLDMLSKSFPSVAQLINTKGLPILFDNLSFRGSDRLKELAEQMIAENQQKAASQPPMPNPLQLKQQEIQMKAQSNAQNMEIQKEKLMNERIDMALKAHLEGRQDAIDLAKMQTEKEVNNVKQFHDLVKHREKLHHDKEIEHFKSHVDRIEKQNDIYKHAISDAGQNMTNSEGGDDKLTNVSENPNHL